MSALAIGTDIGLPALVDRAAAALASARSAAEVLEARELAGMAYDAAKRAARLASIKGAHDELVAKAHRAQADALEIEAAAKRRLADEYDAAQARGEIRSAGNSSKPEELASAPEIGLTHKQVHDARRIRDAEAADPGVTRRALDAELAEKREPTRAALSRAFETTRRVTAADVADVLAPKVPDVPARPPQQSRAEMRQKAVMAGQRSERSLERVADVEVSCLTIIDKTAGLSLDRLLSGCADAKSRERTLRTLHRCRDRLVSLLPAGEAA